MAFTLPPLPYDYSALEPHIDTQTMQIHHDKHHADGSYTLTEHNCPVDCVARDYPQACEHELKLYEDVLGTPLVREDLIAEGGTCCRYRIGPG